MENQDILESSPRSEFRYYIEKYAYPVIIGLILVLTLISRFYGLGWRVMSHDEVNHVVPSFDYFQGRVYRHDPVTHGPMQFHLVALSYFLFGDNDFSSRIPSALFSVATVAAVLFLFKKYLGKIGSVIGGALFLISPYMLYYGRYTRNEAFVALFTVLAIYAVFRYLDRGDHKSQFLLTTVTVLHFATKETAYIYAAQMLLFLALYFVAVLLRMEWPAQRDKTNFLIFAAGAIGMILAAVGVAAVNAKPAADQPAPVVEGAVEAAAASNNIIALEVGALAIAIILGVFAITILIRSLGWQQIKHQRSFDLLILLGTLVLPQLTAFPMKIIGWNPLDYELPGLLKTSAVLFIMLLISAGIGVLWQKRVWILNAILFYSIFVVLYTSFFMNGMGFFTGIVGSLGYWLLQQGVERGSQPWYYFGLVQIPVYEYLAAAGTILAAYLGIRLKPLPEKTRSSPEEDLTIGYDERSEIITTEQEYQVTETNSVPVLILLLFWSITSLLAYSIAGEKMPWLTVHVALPLLLSTAWGIGKLIEKINWNTYPKKSALAVLLLLPILFTSFASVMGGILGATPPFQGNTLDQLRTTTSFLSACLFFAGSLGGLYYFIKQWSFNQIIRTFALFVFVILGLLTARTAYMANFINYDNAKEYLVYAHAARGPKDILEQVEEISRRTTGGLDIKVAYDNDSLYPFWWYFRNYPNKHWFADTPTRDLRDYPIIIAGEDSYGKLEPIIKDSYIQNEYMRLWWPNQDYWNLTWQRISDAITTPGMREAIFNIWLNRDYTKYAEVTGKTDLTLENWSPRSKFKLYIRKDIISEIWNYGVAPVIPDTEAIDPYENNVLTLAADLIIGGAGVETGQFMEPKGIATSPDDRLYVVDMRNHRVQRFSADGEFEIAWGAYGDIDLGTGTPGTFKEPWGIAIGSDGSVFVADTWNHRIQKFTADGEFITSWGYFGQDGSPNAFYGPRDVAIDSKDRVYVSDTGNKRVVIFTSEGDYLGQVGTAGMALGQFDEQVGIAVNAEGTLYVADTWNQRIQSFREGMTENTFIPL